MVYASTIFLSSFALIGAANDMMGNAIFSGYISSVCAAFAGVVGYMTFVQAEMMNAKTIASLLPFFVISGAGLDLGVFKDGMIVLIGVVYILTRSLGKYLGAHYSAKLMKCEPQICKYLGITLLPQAGVALGMCVTARQLGAEGDLIRNITLFAILIYELVGPLLTKMALQAAGEIHPMDEAVRNRRQHKLEQANAEKK